MENCDISLLLRFAEMIQNRYKSETNENAKASLEKDLKLVKDEIGKRVLDLPNDVPIFPPIKEEKFNSPVKESFSSLHIESPQPLPQNSEIQSSNASFQSTSGHGSLMLTGDDIAAKFTAFMKAKNSQKTRSRIPIPKAK